MHAAGVAAASGGSSGAGGLYLVPCAWRWPACVVLHLPPHDAHCRATRGNSKTSIRKMRFRCENPVSHTPNFSSHFVEDIRHREGLLRAILRKRLRCVCGLLECTGTCTRSQRPCARLSLPGWQVVRVSRCSRHLDSAAQRQMWTSIAEQARRRRLI